MIKTKIKKAIALAWIVVLSAATIGTTTFAATIGSVDITGGTSTDVIWDDTFPGTATGSTTVIVTAQVLPTLNMVISTGSIDLGVLTADITSTGSLNIEIGTNATDGVVLTAKSGSGGLTNLSNNNLQINNLTTDGIAESYTFGSTAGTNDSDISGFLLDPDLTTTQIFDSSIKTIYKSNKPERSDGTDVDVVFTVAATSNAQTAAGNYQDEITLTVTGNF